MARKVRVAIADDHRPIRAMLWDLLRPKPGMTLVGEAADGEEAIALVDEVYPDVVLMDITMPRIDGIEATARIRQNFPGVVVIGLSVHKDPTVIGLMRAAGAAGYVLKESAANTLTSTIWTTVYIRHLAPPTNLLH